MTEAKMLVTKASRTCHGILYHCQSCDIFATQQEELLIFWTSGRRDLFRTILRTSFAVLNIGPDDVDDYVRRHAPRYGLKPVAGKRTVERFLSAKTKTNSDTLSAILIGLAEDLKLQTHLPVEDQKKLKPLFDLHDNLIEETKAQTETGVGTVTNQAVRLGREQAANSSLASVADVLLAYLHLSSKASAACEKVFFEDTERKRAFFNTYRYTSTEGIIQKSFTVVHRPTASIPVVRFANYFEYENRTRMSSGIALRFGKEIVFFGQSDKGTSSKTMIFNHAAAPQNRYTGIALTNEPDGGAVSARFVMQRTEVEHHKDAVTGCFPLDDEAIELDTDSKERLRNRVQFGLEQDLIDSAGAIVPQKTMVVRIEELLTRSTLPDGSVAALRLSDGTAFNPADHEFYTFNSALKIKD